MIQEIHKHLIAFERGRMWEELRRCTNFPKYTSPSYYSTEKKIRKKNEDSENGASLPQISERCPIMRYLLVDLGWVINF